MGFQFQYFNRIKSKGNTLKQKYFPVGITSLSASGKKKTKINRIHYVRFKWDPLLPFACLWKHFFINKMFITQVKYIKACSIFS